MTIGQNNEDWAQLKRFQTPNAELIAANERVEVVFMGDSLTEFWGYVAPDFFEAGWVNRGLSGQTTPQMLVRFRQDVIDLRPRVVHVMAGTNDVAGNTGPMTPTETMGNLMTMTELAQRHSIGVVLALVPPSHAGLDHLNELIRDYANRAGVVCADYYSLLDGGSGQLQPKFTEDGIHLTGEGYSRISDVTKAAIATAMLDLI